MVRSVYPIRISTQLVRALSVGVLLSIDGSCTGPWAIRFPHATSQNREIGAFERKNASSVYGHQAVPDTESIIH
jgi:hypothetical protein